MKGVVLAGGTGSRLRPITYTMPKQMIPIGGKPVIEHAISDLRDAGISEIGIVLGEQGHEEIQDHFGDGSGFDVDLTYIYQGKPLGLGHAVGCAEDFVGDDPFVLFLGDDLLQHGIKRFVEDFDSDVYAGSIAVKPVENPSRYGIVKTAKNGDIVGMVEKPSEPPTNLAGIGVFILTKEIFDEIRDLKPSWRGELELSDAIQRLLSRGERFQSYAVDGWWYDVGTPEDVLASNRAVLDEVCVQNQSEREFAGEVVGRVSIGNRSTIESGASVRGPVYIGDDVEIQSGAYVGPFSSIEDGCIINGATIESSVVLRDAEITSNTHFMDSIIGRATSIVEKDERYNGVNIVAGSDGNFRL